MWSPTRARVARTLVACAFACATALAGAASGASSSTVVTADIPSASTLVNGCSAPAATQFGAVLPDAGARTATGAGVCRLTFGSSNATAQLRISQADGAGTAMGLGMQAPAELASDGFPGRTIGVFGASDGLYAWMAGRSSTTYRSLDGGATWSTSTTGLTGNHTDVEFVPGSPATVWVVGEGRYLRRALDGMDATVDFTSQAAALTASGWPGSVDINELTIPDNDTIVIGGSSRWFGVYDISADTWTSFQHTNLSIGNVIAVDALDANTIMAVGNSPNRRAILTTNKGTTSADWAVSAIPGSGTQSPRDVAWGGANRAYAVGTAGMFAVWDGVSWTDRSTNLGVAFDLHGVDSVPGSPDTVIAVDERGGTYRSTDAGVTWTTIGSSGSGSRTGDIHAASATKVYVTAAERSFSDSSDGGLTWDPAVPGGSEQLLGVSASPTNGQRLLAVGYNARRSTNGGTTWTTAALTGGSLNAVSLVDDDRGWAVGDAARIRFTSDLGSTWTAQAPPAGITQRLHDVRGLDRYGAIAVGDRGAIIATTNGGSSWTTRASGTTRQLTGVDSHDATVLAVGAFGTIVRSTDSGATWSAATSVPAADVALIGVAMVSATTAYAATSAQEVWKTSDGGANWTIAAGATGTAARSIDASGSSIITVGLDYSTSRSFDGGVTWSQATGPTTMHLADVVAIDPHLAIIVGADSTRAKSVAEAGANAQVSDWSAPANDWDSGGFFGVCMQAVGGGAIADWTPDTMNVVGVCETLGTDPWRAVPATGSLAAHTNAAGLGTVDLVWGFRATTMQAPGTYEAGVAFEAVAP